MKTRVVTGGARGIGLELTRRLSGEGARVFVSCRQPSSALEALAGERVTVVSDVEVTRDEGIARLVASVPGPVDLLVANAGILERGSFDTLDAESILRQFETNALAPLRLVRAFSDKLGEGAKVALVTSRMGSIADNGSGGYYGYRMSKAALNAAGKSLALDLRARKIAVAILHPGFVRTDMTGGAGDVDAGESAANLIARIDALTLETSGTFWHANGSVLPW